MAPAAETPSLALPEPLAKAVLYGGAPFFCHPLKPLLNAVAGQPYERAYSHFRRDHQDPMNLIFHSFCLVFQLGFNYSLLSEAGTGIAKALGAGKTGAELLPGVTSAAWAWSLLRAKEAPVAVRLLAAGAVALAHALKEKLPPHWRQATFFTGILEMLAIQVFVINKAKDTKGTGRKALNVPQLLGLVAFRTALGAAFQRFLAGSLSSAPARAVTNTLLGAWMLKVSQDPFAAKSGGGAVKTPFFLGLSGWMLALLTDQSWLYFYSGGFLASMTQGVSHHYAGEESTLPQLANVSDELAHTTFFPNILLHSIYQTITSGRGPAFGGKSA